MYHAHSRLYRRRTELAFPWLPLASTTLRTLRISAFTTSTMRVRSVPALAKSSRLHLPHHHAYTSNHFLLLLPNMSTFTRATPSTKTHCTIRSRPTCTCTQPWPVYWHGLERAAAVAPVADCTNTASPFRTRGIAILQGTRVLAALPQTLTVPLFWLR